MIPSWLKSPLKPLDAAAEQAARAREAQLTKPPGSLGRLEDVAVFFAAAQGRVKPSVDSIWISVFAGDHGVTEEGVSAFPQSVTAEMVKNFARGGAAISVLARTLGAQLEVLDLGTVQDIEPVPGVRHLHLGRGTANLMREPAMSIVQCAAALDAGRQAAERARLGGADLFIGGEMGIGNTTAASAIAAVLLNLPACEVVGPGTGLNEVGVSHKAQVVEAALTLHRPDLQGPFDALYRLGGFEIAALVGAYISCAQLGLPVLIDGFITSSAALMADRLCPGSSAWFVYSHRSAEPGHAAVLKGLNAEPLLSLGMRLGEGSGAAVAVPVLQLACALHGGMATFSEAQVSDKL